MTKFRFYSAKWCNKLRRNEFVAKVSLSARVIFLRARTHPLSRDGYRSSFALGTISEGPHKKIIRLRPFFRRLKIHFVFYAHHHVHCDRSTRGMPLRRNLRASQPRLIKPDDLFSNKLPPKPLRVISQQTVANLIKQRFRREIIQRIWFVGWG